MNPVLYIESNSFVSHSLRKTYESLVNETGQIIDIDNGSPILYAKNYQGELKRGEKIVNPTYRFYDEREWRLVPKSENIGLNPIVIDNKKYQSDKAIYNQQIQSYLLKFDLQDISYIIVKDASEVQKVYQILSAIFNKDIMDLQFITILTTEQIVGDF